MKDKQQLYRATDCVRSRDASTAACV